MTDLQSLIKISLSPDSLSLVLFSISTYGYIVRLKYLYNGLFRVGLMLFIKALRASLQRSR